MKTNQKDSLLVQFEDQLQKVNLKTIKGGKEIWVCTQCDCGSDDYTIDDSVGME